jgi:hypothetical protein
MNLEDITQYDNCDYLEPYGISDLCLYVKYTRIEVSSLPIIFSTTLLVDSIEANRYFDEYISLTDELISEGIDPTTGPEDFDMTLLDNTPFDSICYETFLIVDYLIKINESLKVYNIKTIQSQPSYYINMDDPNFKSYFQIPFVEFSGSVDAIKIYEQIKSDSRLSKCFFNTFYEKDSSDEIIIRFFIGRPYIDLHGSPNSGFSDNDFWEIICTIAEELNLHA